MSDQHRPGPGTLVVMGCSSVAGMFVGRYMSRLVRTRSAFRRGQQKALSENSSCRLGANLRGPLSDQQSSVHAHAVLADDMEHLAARLLYIDSLFVNIISGDLASSAGTQEPLRQYWKDAHRTFKLVVARTCRLAEVAERSADDVADLAIFLATESVPAARRRLVLHEYMEKIEDALEGPTDSVRTAMLAFEHSFGCSATENEAEAWTANETKNSVGEIHCQLQSARTGILCLFRFSDGLLADLQTFSTRLFLLDPKPSELSAILAADLKIIGRLYMVAGMAFQHYRSMLLGPEAMYAK
ncbi:hypothetical protein EIP91_004947 [Steccherinum ochraceum]|uniref:Uncharacterized protein n=1 Tax=Steccherinum ochraceum TaxID=92696 RepID=A0A4R0RAI5_9APHY|nr:hypothetical protein EIP91_004947 [Steccherinum ochraceum]